MRHAFRRALAISFVGLASVAAPSCIPDVVPTHASTSSSSASSSASSSSAGGASTSTGSAVSSCFDGTKNGNESDVDCGGSCPTQCALGAKCVKSTDCIAGTCNAAGRCSGEPRGEWVRLSPASAPSARYTHAMASIVDPNGCVVLVGGAASALSADVSWKWNGTTWAQLTTGVVPAGSIGPVATQWSTGVVTLDGAGNTSWFDGTQWNAISTPAPGPSSHAYGTLGFDAAHAKAILYGGETSGTTPNNETWVLQGTAPNLSWTQLSPPHTPGPLGAAVSAFDAAEGLFLVFGGRNLTTGTISDRSFTFDGSDWKEISTTLRPPPRSFAAMAYNPDQKHVILHGGADVGGVIRSDTWEWTSTRGWSRVLENSPVPFYWNAMAYCASSKRMIMLGGAGPTSTISNDTWELHEFGEACDDDTSCSGSRCVDHVCCSSDTCATGEKCNTVLNPGICSQ